jgi:hypothetical protein
VKIIEYPTVKISMKSFEGQGKLEEMLTEKEVNLSSFLEKI